MIKGIDGQVMIHRITDFAKESAAINKRDDVAQAQFASTFREQVQEKQVQVQDTNKSEQQGAISRDGRNQNQQEREKSKHKDDKNQENGLLADDLPEVGLPNDAIGRKLDIMA